MSGAFTVSDHLFPLRNVESLNYEFTKMSVRSYK